MSGGAGYTPGNEATLTTGGPADGTTNETKVGAGGMLGQAGTAGYAAGGAAGACTSGNANIVWRVAGTRLGTLG